MYLCSNCLNVAACCGFLIGCVLRVLDVLLQALGVELAEVLEYSNKFTGDVPFDRLDFDENLAHRRCTCAATA